MRVRVDEPGLDPVFASVGQRVWSNAFAERIREENLKARREGHRIMNQIPQAGFQEDVLLSDADIVIEGGKRGLGKTHVALLGALPYMSNPDVSMYGFRKFEDDVRRGIWKSSKQVYRPFAVSAEATFEWRFLGGTGASMKMEHLQDPKKISDRFRGVEMAYIIIEELAEHTRENMDVLFELLSSNRSTAGVKPKCMCTCNPVGKSNKLRMFLDWYIDPETDLAIPERSGKIRYFFRYGTDVSEIAWGDSPEEVYAHAAAHSKIEGMCAETGLSYRDFITSLVFITGEYHDNIMLRTVDPSYMKRISARGGESTQNDILGLWRDIDTGSALLTEKDMTKFFDNTERRDGVMRASADVALTGDFFVIWAFDGHHVCDLEAWYGVPSDEVVQKVRHFLARNGVREENFTYDANGLGLWLKDTFKYARGFNNKSAPSDPRLWNNLKSESAEKFIKAVKAGEFSISQDILMRSLTDSKKRTFTIRERLMEERRALKRKDNSGGIFEIISKPQMKTEIGHSPDFIESLFMVMPLMAVSRTIERSGFECL